ncbi:hypothetical protein B0J14DRAFT_634169 [Halenospora varia]|nr:hypothetical protein B0J14DRAFT_634169 [Halenospora varia]
MITFLMCTPLAYTWDKTITDGHCIDEQEVLLWISFSNIVTDVLMLILPLPILWRLHIPVNQMLGLVITFLTFSLGLTTSISRPRTFFVTPVFLDPAWNVVGLMIWTIAEPSSYLIAACLPVLRPLFGPLFKNDLFQVTGIKFLAIRSKKASRSRNVGGGSESEHWYGHPGKSSLPHLSDGNDQNYLVACDRPETGSYLDIERGSRREASSYFPGTQVEKGYIL